MLHESSDYIVDKCEGPTAYVSSLIVCSNVMPLYGQAACVQVFCVHCIDTSSDKQLLYHVHQDHCTCDCIVDIPSTLRQLAPAYTQL